MDPMTEKLAPLETGLLVSLMRILGGFYDIVFINSHSWTYLVNYNILPIIV